MYERKLRYQVETSNTKLPVTPPRRSNESPRRISQRIHRSKVANEVLQKTPHTKITIKPPLIENLWYVCHSNIKDNKKKLLQLLVLLVGIGLLFWQIEDTLKAFIDGNTTFNVHKTTKESQVTPTILFCPMEYWDNGLFNFTEPNPSDEDWMYSQFYHLDDNLNLTLFRYSYNTTSGKYEEIKFDLILGNNTDAFVNVEELMNPYIGICLALTPDPSIEMNIMDQLILVAQFNSSDELETPLVEVFFVNQEDLYGFIFPEVLEELEEPYKISLQAGTMVWVYIQSLVWKYRTTSKRPCEDYSKSDSSSMKCILKKQINCFKLDGPSKNCHCIPQNLFKTHFALDNTTWDTTWEKCKTDDEYRVCSRVMDECYYKQISRDAIDGCPLPCERKVYRGQTRMANGFGKAISPNAMVMKFKFNTMDVEERNEVLIQELPFFIGSVGGSLGLFIGFSFTCIFGKIIDYSITT